MERDVETIFGKDALAVSRFEEGSTWHLNVLTDRQPPQEAMTRFEACLASDDIYQRPTPIADEDWLVKVQKDLPAIRAGRYWVHGRHVLDRPPSGSLPLLVEGTSAFGSGHHESTMGCLLALDALARRMRPHRILDIGTGTGILAIAAALTWRVPVVAGDNDPEAVRVARATVNANRVARFVRCVLADGPRGRSVAAGAPYDLIIANILARPLMAMAPQFARRTKPGSKLILSGVLAHQAGPVAATYRTAGFVKARTIVLGEWATLLLGRR